ncbi:glycosyltransferase family 4 protein [Marinomonas algicola]|uniref:glycosyltransferase family 4 protein n=1 Tax=Marinomonas algicola TaxID=2773454 RepID=UPI00174ACC1D|nr:glycosyltransferase [Marinomonas algicola]
MPLLKQSRLVLGLITQTVRKAMVALIRKLMGIPWLRVFALKILNHLPFVKHRLQRLLASVPQNITPIKRDPGNAEDYQNLLAVTPCPVRSHYDDLQVTPERLERVERDIQKVVLTGHFNGSYSLASVNRHIINRCLLETPSVDWRIQPYEGEMAPKVFDTPKGIDEVERLNRRLNKPIHSTVSDGAEVSIYHHYPLITPKKEDKTSIALFFWEESKVAQAIIDQLNEQYDGVLVTTWFVKKALIDSGCVLPIEVTPLPLEAYPQVSEALDTAAKEGDTFTSVADELPQVGKDKVTFLHVSSCFPRKGVDLLLEAFDQAAAEDETLYLVIKTFPNPHNQIKSWLQQYVRPHLQARIQIIEQDMSAAEMALLYQQADAVVLPTRGEGLNLPAIEAGVYKKALIVTGYGAHMDFVDEENAYLLDFRFANADTHVNDGRSVWTEVSVPKLANTLQLVAEKIKVSDVSLQEKAHNLHQSVQTVFFEKNATQKLLLSIWNIQQFQKIKINKVDQKRACNLQVDLFSTWGEECGIAEYSHSLIAGLSPNSAKICIHHPLKRRFIENELDGRLSFVDSWVYGGDGPDLLSQDIRGDVIWLQHHFAFYGLTQKVANGIAYQRQQGKLVYITLHTTRPLLSYDNNSLQSAVTCLSLFDRILVHAVDDLNTLKRLGLTDNVLLMPHGVKAPMSPIKNSQTTSRHMPYSPSEDFIVGSFGFLLPHKGVDILIKGFSMALDRHSIPEHSRLRLVNAVRPDGTSFYEKERCESLIKQLGLQEKVDWYTDFLPINDCESLLSECNVLILPYQFTLESCSGAVRNAIISCEHVATTPAPIFDEVREVTHSLAGYGAEPIHHFLKEFAERASSNAFDALLIERGKWLQQHSWPIIANRHTSLFTAGMVEKQLNSMKNEIMNLVEEKTL